MIFIETKFAVLDILALHEGEAVSGQELAESLKVSRMAVNKAVKALVKSGYTISAQTNKGYTLQKGADVFSKSEIQKLYKGMVFFESTAKSTNTTARLLAENGAGHGTLCAAAEQTGGRGRRGRSFYSPINSGIYFSVILKNISLENSGFITAAAAVAVRRTIQKLYGIELKIKWVNDLYINGKKTGGILTEASAGFENGEADYAVVGIGLNLYEPEGGFPPELKDIAGAVFKSSEGISRSRICAETASELLMLCENSSGIIDEYREASCIIGKKVYAVRSGESRLALVTGINERGHLCVVYENNSKDTLYFGEVSIVPEKTV